MTSRYGEQAPVCTCPEAARWPIPDALRWDLGVGDELAAFIAEWHAERVA